MDIHVRVLDFDSNSLQQTAAPMADELLHCPDCHRATEVVLDHSTGDTVCTECALVLEAHYIDEGSEWRNFADDGGGEDRDPSRVGGANDPFLSNAPLVTRIAYSGPQKTQADALPRMRVSAGGTDPEQSLVEAFRAINEMAERLGLVGTIRDGAKEVYKRLDESKACPRGKKRDVFYAACLYVACRNENKPRTYKELATVTSAGAAAKKEIGRMTTLIKKVLGEEAGQQVLDIGVVRAADYLRRFCSRLGMGNQEMRAAQEAARRLEAGLDVRRNPESIAAAIIYMVVQRAGATKTVKDVVKETSLPRMCGAVAPNLGLPRTMEGPSSGLERMRGTVTLSLKTPGEPAVLPLAVGADTLPPEETHQEKAATPAMRGAVQQPREKAASEGCPAIADMAGRLGIAPEIRDRAMEVFRRMEEVKGKAHYYYTKGAGRSGDALYAACIYVASRAAGAPRTFKELATATREGSSSKKDIGKLIALIRKRLGDEAGGEAMDIGVVRSADYMERFGSLLGMGEGEVRAVQEAARRMQDQLDVRRNPDSTAAAIIYMAMQQRPGTGRSIRDVSVVTGVAENTIKQAYRELHPHSQLLFG
ncbi:Transcription initiation factor IIB [Dichanthelium oligosanthes]|uniref:Transcription initiation factor IIB n=1 Tax=Dichanthelium oligosanthes TaxID=888268 RepID=A0A1E5WLH7_9POAL|nr:Transcription initiation factor IIB [Dichanthelium oligosanthes]